MNPFVLFFLTIISSCCFAEVPFDMALQVLTPSSGVLHVESSAISSNVSQSVLQSYDLKVWDELSRGELVAEHSLDIGINDSNGFFRVEHSFDTYPGTEEFDYASDPLGTVFYISNMGTDTNSGTVAEPFKTLNHAATKMRAGDTLLLERGSVFYERLFPVSGSDNHWVRYGAYGNDSVPLPVLSGAAPPELTHEGFWGNVSSNLWVRENTPVDIGQLYVSNRADLATKCWSLDELRDEWDFYYDAFSNPVSSGALYVLSPTNPGLIDVEFALSQHVVPVDDCSYVVFEKIHLTRGGAHGFGGERSDHIIIRDCRMDYMGGGYLFTRGTNHVRYGNAVEFWGDARDILVKENIIEEIYDTALTNQHDDRGALQQNIHYISNRIINCGLASFEFWMHTDLSTMRGIYFVDNTCINSGQGWGKERVDRNSFQVASFGNSAELHDIRIEFNSFITDEVIPTVTNSEGGDYSLLFFAQIPEEQRVEVTFTNNQWTTIVPEPHVVWQ